jgi:hypothetical protein
MTCSLFSLNDFYEIYYDASKVTSILRFRRAQDSPGELVDYDSLPQRVQNDIFNALKKAILNDRKRLAEAGIDPDYNPLTDNEPSPEPETDQT